LAVGWTIWKKPYANNTSVWGGFPAGNSKNQNGSSYLSTGGASSATGTNLNDTSDASINSSLGNIDSELNGLDNDSSKTAPGADEQQVF
jgi:hypothetical protein